MPALLAEASAVDCAKSTYKRSVALEDLRTPSSTGALLIPALKKHLAPELADFLTKRQDGTRAVTRSMIDRVLGARAEEFSAAPTTATKVVPVGDHDRLGPVFDNLPGDTGHWGLNYFEHMLDPFRHAAPSYVMEIASGDFNEDRLASEMPDNIAGIVVIRLHDDG